MGANLVRNTNSCKVFNRTSQKRQDRQDKQDEQVRKVLTFLIGGWSSESCVKGEYGWCLTLEVGLGESLVEADGI